MLPTYVSGIIDINFIMLCKLILSFDIISSLVEKANAWLESQGEVTLVSCETLVWSGLKVDDIFSDNTIALKSFDGSLNSKKNKTFYLRGLR